MGILRSKHTVKRIEKRMVAKTNTEAVWIDYSGEKWKPMSQDWGDKMKKKGMQSQHVAYDFGFSQGQTHERATKHACK